MEGIECIVWNTLNIHTLPLIVFFYSCGHVMSDDKLEMNYILVFETENVVFATRPHTHMCVFTPACVY